MPPAPENKEIADKVFFYRSYFMHSDCAPMIGIAEIIPLVSGEYLQSLSATNQAG